MQTHYDRRWNNVHDGYSKPRSCIDRMQDQIATQQDRCSIGAQIDTLMPPVIARICCNLDETLS